MTLCADHGEPASYALIRTALRMLRLPTHVISGDHDMEPKRLDDFYTGLGIPKLPYSPAILGTQLGPNRNGREW